MPTPVGHALAGLAVHALTARRAPDLQSLQRAALCLVSATLPDVDFAFRLLDGVNHHQKETHSLGAAVLWAVIVATFARAAGAAGAGRLGAAAGLAWASHVALDFVGRDTHPPIGVMAFWPLARSHVHAPFSLFLDVGRTAEWRVLVNNALALAWELAVLLPLCWAVFAHARRRLRPAPCRREDPARR